MVVGQRNSGVGVGWGGVFRNAREVVVLCRGGPG